LFLVLLLFITSCNTTASPSTLESILVRPLDTSIQVGKTQQDMAIAAYSDGSTSNITGDCTWTSSDSAAASIDTLGLATGVGLGATTIRATLEEISGSADLAIIAPTVLESISVTPESVTIGVDDTRQFRATGAYSDGSTSDITGDVTWESSDPTVASIDTLGLATGVALGTTTIMAALEGISDSTSLTVIVPILESISVTPESVTIGVDDTRQFRATGAYSDGSTLDITGDVTWESSDTAVATIDTGGLATAVASGTTAIMAALEGISDSATLNVTEVAPTLESVSVTPESAEIEGGQTRQYKATGTYSDSSMVDITAEVSWASSELLVATIDSAGLATAVGSGTTIISATLDTVSGIATLDVTAAPVPPNIPAGHFNLPCSTCHATGAGGAPIWPTVPPHAGDTIEICLACHQQS
jgi:hypothetical protein